MKPLDDAQLKELARLESEEAGLGRGKKVALGVMFGVEGAAGGAILALANGALWVLGAAFGLLGVVVLGAIYLLIPRRARLTFAVRSSTTREPESWAAWQRDGASTHREPKKPYWPQ